MSGSSPNVTDTARIIEPLLHIADFTWNGGPAELAPTLGRLAREAEAGGIARLTVMDHFWQIGPVGPVGPVGPPEESMLEAYATLGYLAAVTERVLLHTLVTGVVYREPGFLAKVISTLDVLSGGRAGLGIGAAWFEEEAEGLGFAFPPLGERFERLEETLQICLQMWGEDDGAFDGRHYRLGRTLNSPAALSRPHPFVLVGGGGERKTRTEINDQRNPRHYEGHSGEHPLERRVIRRLAVRAQHKLDRQIEQRTEASDNSVTRHVLATTELNVQSVAGVRERVAGDDRVDRRQPEDQIVVLAARVRGHAKRPRSGRMKVSFALARAQPGEVLTLHAVRAFGVDAELLDPILPGVCGRSVHREPKPTGVALVAGRGEADGGRALAQLVGNGQWVEQHDVVAELDPTRRNKLGPPLLLLPVRMR